MITAGRFNSRGIPLNISEIELLKLFRDKVYPGVGGDYITRQTVGCVTDGVLNNGITIEVKNDMASVKTNNLFFEIEQSFDDKKTWKRSGLALCADKGTDYFVIAGHVPTQHHVFYAPPNFWLKLVDGYRVCTTRLGVNGNRDGLYGRGRVVPMWDLISSLEDVG